VSAFSILTSSRNLESDQMVSSDLLRRDWNLTEEIKNNDIPKMIFFNDPRENDEIYEMAFKKKEVAKRKRRRRKFGKQISSRWR